MTAKLATVDDRILASVEDAAAVRDGNILQHRASDKQRVGSLQFGCGYLSPYFVSDPERMEVVFEDAYVLIHEKRISSKSDLIQILEQITKSGKPLLIIRRGCWRRGAQGHVANGVVRTKLTLTHEDIAQLIGTSRETITRTLSEFRKKDIVELKGSTLIIHDKVALGRLVKA